MSSITFPTLLIFARMLRKIAFWSVDECMHRKEWHKQNGQTKWTHVQYCPVKLHSRSSQTRLHMMLDIARIWQNDWVTLRQETLEEKAGHCQDSTLHILHPFEVAMLRRALWCFVHVCNEIMCAYCVYTVYTPENIYIYNTIICIYIYIMSTRD